MSILEGLDPALATVLLLTLNGLAPLPRAAVCIPAGAALGWGALGPSMFGSALGFALAFLIVRFALKARVERCIARHPRLGVVMRAVEAEGWRLLALLRLGSPIPGPLINVACGITRMRFGAFLLTSVAAVLPQTVLFVYLGRAGAQVLASGSPLSPDTLAVLGGIALTLLALWRLVLAAKRQTARVLVETAASRL